VVEVCRLALLEVVACKLASWVEKVRAELVSCRLASPDKSVWQVGSTEQAWGCGQHEWAESCQTGRSGPAAHGGAGGRT